MGRAMVRGGFHRGSSDGREQRNFICGDVNARLRRRDGEIDKDFALIDQHAWECYLKETEGTQDTNISETVRVAPAVHVVATKDSRPWICKVCTAQNNPGNLICLSCCTFRDTQSVC